MLYEDVVQAINPYGPYQKRLYVLLCFAGVTGAFHTMVTVFIMAVPDHRCALPGLDNDTYVSQGAWHDQLVKMTIPYDHDDQRWDQCHYYTHRNSSHPLHSSNATSKCSRWVYSTEYFEETVISELNLVCGDKEKITFANSVLMGGKLAGSLVLGSLSDIIGRKKTMMISAVGQFVAGMATGFVSSYEVFVALRFLTMIFSMGFFLSVFVSCMELGGSAQRTVVGIVIEMFWALGLFMLVFIAYFLRNWHHLQICLSCFSLVYIVHFFVVPESPRWLVSRGRYQEASDILRKAARVNKVEVSEKVLSLQDLKSDEPKEKVWRMFTNPRLLARCLIIYFNWSVISLVFYGLGLNVGSLSGNLYLNFLYASIAEALSYVLCLVGLFHVGRRPLHCFTMFLGGVACVAIIFPVLYGSDDVHWVTITLSMIGKFGISAAFAIIYVFTAELFPTMVRNSGMGTSSLAARFGGIASPYIGALGQYVSGDFGTALPALVFGTLSVMAGVCAIFLPETFNKKLPETIEDAKMFGRADKKKNAYCLEQVSKNDEKKSDGSFTKY